MLIVNWLFVSAISRRNPRTPRKLLHAPPIKKKKLSTGNGPGQAKGTRRQKQIRKKKNETILKSEVTPEKWAYLVAMNARISKKNAIRNPKQEFRNVAGELTGDTPTRNKKES